MNISFPSVALQPDSRFDFYVADLLNLCFQKAVTEWRIRPSKELYSHRTTQKNAEDNIKTDLN